MNSKAPLSFQRSSAQSQNFPVATCRRRICTAPLSPAGQSVSPEISRIVETIEPFVGEVIVVPIKCARGRSAARTLTQRIKTRTSSPVIQNNFRERRLGRSFLLRRLCVTRRRRLPGGETAPLQLSKGVGENFSRINEVQLPAGPCLHSRGTGPPCGRPIHSSPVRARPIAPHLQSRC